MLKTSRLMVVSALFAVLTAIGAQLRIPFPVVPITLQTLMVILSGTILGPYAGACSQILYVVLGLLGLPVFAGGGGIHYILHPTFGFLAGFIPGSWLAGYIVQKKRQDGRLWSYIPACIAGMAVIYLCGSAVLYLNLNFIAGKSVSLYSVAKMGLIPFLPGDVLKIVVISFLSSRIVPILKNRGLIQ